FVETRHVFHHHVHHHHVRDRARVQNAAAKTQPQRSPARPGAPTYDRSRPSSPDLASIRYDGPPPKAATTRRPARDLGYGTRPASGVRGQTDGRRPQSGFSARDPDGRFTRPRAEGVGRPGGPPPSAQPPRPPSAGRGAGSPERAPSAAPPRPSPEAYDPPA